MVLTVLSAFARRNVDPWEEAAGLCRLSADMAMSKLVAMLEGLPGQASLAERTATAGRLLPLLPQPVQSIGGHEATVRGTLSTVRSRPMADLSLVLTWLALMLLGQWIFSGFAARTPAESAVTATVPTGAHDPSADRGRQ
jgi:hypothetical protein